MRRRFVAALQRLLGPLTDCTPVATVRYTFLCFVSPQRPYQAAFMASFLSYTAARKPKSYCGTRNCCQFTVSRVTTKLPRIFDPFPFPCCCRIALIVFQLAAIFDSNGDIDVNRFDMTECFRSEPSFGQSIPHFVDRSSRRPLRHTVSEAPLRPRHAVLPGKG